jgi:tetraacyldisaccharide 4'-kinase
MPTTSGTSFRQRYLALVSGQDRGVLASLGRLLLWLASLVYGLLVRVRNLFYQRGWWRSTRVAIPVVSVGNLTVGGTGKTPCVEHVADFYRSRDLRVAILSRGYGTQAGLNDEALVLAQNLPDVPPLVGPDRVALALTAIEELESEILVLDDGFQHRRLARNLDVVLIDATLPWGYGHLLPRGLLREPPAGLRRAGVVVLTRCDQVSQANLDAVRRRIARLAPGVAVVETTHRPIELVNSAGAQQPLETLQGRNVAGFCGLGNPAAFRRTLLDLAANVIAFRAYPDHHAYNLADVEQLRSWARSLPDDTLLLTTQKDLVKLRVLQLGGRPLWAVRIRLAFRAGQEILEEQLLRSAPT